MFRTVRAAPALVRSLTCPVCGRSMPLDEPGMVAAQAAWGFCGAIAGDDSGVIGLLLVTRTTPQDPLSGSASVSAAWVAREARGRGVGRALVRAAADALVQVQGMALLASADPLRRCAALPTGFLRGCGFAPSRDPRVWRLDLSTTVVVPRRHVRTAWNRLAAVVRPVPPPAPALRER